MLTRSDLHGYQLRAAEFIKSKPGSALFLGMGMGKTAASLTAIADLMETLEASFVLVISPKRVAETGWQEEAARWEHLRGLKFRKVLGSAKERADALEGLRRDTVYVTNRENVCWLVSYFKDKKRPFPFDTLVIDELSGFKSRAAQRFKALRGVMKNVCRVVGLTGTPAPNGLADLWAQIFLLDGGKRLGRTVTEYRRRWFHPVKSNGRIVYEWGPNEGACDAINEAIADISLSMKAEDYLSLPPLLSHVVRVRMPKEAERKYKTVERECVLKLQEGEVTALSAAAITNKLLQMSNGGIYTDEGAAAEVHGEKLEALDEILEAAHGEPVLLFYSFRFDADRIKARFPFARELKSARDVSDWNAGRVPLLIAHPASAGHGLNLQRGGSVCVWYGLTWSLELWEQARARLHRQGQTRPVVEYVIIADGTEDEAVLHALQNKKNVQDALLEALKK